MLRKLKAKIRLKKRKESNTMKTKILDKLEGKKSKFKKGISEDSLTDIEFLFI